MPVVADVAYRRGIQISQRKPSQVEQRKHHLQLLVVRHLGRIVKFTPGAPLTTIAANHTYHTKPHEAVSIAVGNYQIIPPLAI